MIRCHMLFYMVPQCKGLKLYKFTDCQDFELPNDAVELDRKSGYFLTAQELEDRERKAFEAARSGEWTRLEECTEHERFTNGHDGGTLYIDKYKLFDDYKKEREK